MKREHHHLHPPSNPELCSSVAGGGGGNCGAGASSSSASVAAKAKAKAWEDEIQNDSGMDELLAVLGYEVRSSKMAEVAQKLEQLEEVMGKAAAVTEDGFSQLASDTVHYNPSDLSNWLENMLSELNPPNFDPLSAAAAAAASAAAAPPFTPAESSTITSSHYHLFDDSSTDDLKVIPGRAIYSSNSTTSSDPCSRENKRFKFSSPPWAAVAPMAETMPPQSSIARPVVLVDSVEDGVRLVHSLTACADAVQQDNLKLAEMLVKQISILAASQAGAMGKVATFFAEALTLKIYRLSPPLDSLLNDDDLQMSFYDASPYLKFAHFTANQAILEAFAGKSRLHVIDFGMKQGQQWPALMQALALRPGGAPSLRITGIGPPPPDGADRLQDVGWKLAQFAKSVNVKFEYRGLVAASLADLSAAALDLRPGEAVAVNSVFELHRLLAVPGATERLLAAVREMRPEIFTVVEQEANHNSAVFLDRFMESLHYYSTMFDSLEGGGGGGCGGAVSDEDRVMAEVYLGRQICNVVACDGAERVERHEPLGQWRGRMERAGFAPAHLGSNAFRQASTLLEVFAGGEGYRVEENGGCLTLGWHTRPLIATSAWQIAGGRHQNALLS